MTQEEEKELNRAAINLFLDPSKDDTVSLEDDFYFYKIYGKESWDKRKAERVGKDLIEKKKLGLI